MEILKQIPPDSPSNIRLTILDNEIDENHAKNEPSTILFESEIKNCNIKLLAFEKQLKVLYAGITTLCEYLTDKFGVEVIDKSVLMNECNLEWNEIQELVKSMSILNRKYNAFSNPPGLRRSTRQVHAKWAKEYQRNRKVNVKLPHRRMKKKKRVIKNEILDSEDDRDVLLNPSDYEIDSSSDTDDSSVAPDPKKICSNTPKKSNSKSSCKLKTHLVDIDKPLEEDKICEEIETEDNEVVSNPQSTNEKELTLPRKRKRKKVERVQSVDESESEARRKRGRPKKKPEEKVIHSDKIPMQCAECGKILKGCGSLKSHMNMHADLRPYPCPELGCGKRFRVKNKLSLHLLIHKGEKTEQCRFCGRLFFFLKDLERHERTHTGEKPFPCPHQNCNKSFNVKQHLTLHLRVHTGEKPYHCVVCDKSFSQANSLRIHKKIHERAKVNYINGPQVVNNICSAPKKPKNSTSRKKKVKEDTKISAEPPITKTIPTSPALPVVPEPDHIPIVDLRIEPQPSQTLQPNQLPISILEPTHHHPREQKELLTLVLQSPMNPTLTSHARVISPETQMLSTSSSNSNHIQFILTPTSTLVTPQIITSVQEAWKLQNPQPTIISSSSVSRVKLPYYGIEMGSNPLPISVISPRNSNINLSAGVGENIIRLSQIGLGIQRPTSSSTPETGVDPSRISTTNTLQY